MMNGPLTGLSDFAVKVGFAVTILGALATYWWMNQASEPITQCGGTNIPQRLLCSNDPQSDAAECVKALEGAGQVTAAIRVLRIDFIFLAAVFTFLCLACEDIGRLWGGHAGHAARLSGLVSWLAILGAVADVIEDTAWVLMIKKNAYALASLAAWATRVKWSLVVLIVIFLVVSGIALSGTVPYTIK
jgi:hypothetical protein